MRDTIFEKKKFIYRVSYFKTSIIDLNVQNNTHLYKYSYQMFIHCHDKFRKIIGKNIIKTLYLDTVDDEEKTESTIRICKGWRHI